MIEGELAAYWLAKLPLHDAPRSGEAKGRVVAGILSAAPYLARAEGWELLRAYLRLLLPLDPSPATVETVQEYQRVIANATLRTDDDLTALEKSLTGAKPDEVIPLLKDALERHRATGDFRGLLVSGLRLGRVSEVGR